MYCNEYGQYVDNAEYFYNKYNECYCLVGTSRTFESLHDLESAFESADLLTEIPMPDYITADYCDVTEW